MGTVRNWYANGRAVTGFVPEKSADPGSLYPTGQTAVEREATVKLKEQAKTFAGLKVEKTSSGSDVAAFTGERVGGQTRITGSSL